METPEQRMMGVLEWYLTSLHIVRKVKTPLRQDEFSKNSERVFLQMKIIFLSFIVIIAKKQLYDKQKSNCIILAVFFQGTQAKKPYNPVIGETFHCSYKVPNEGGKNGDQLRVKFVGEQVSHHPPGNYFLPY